jgi:S1-C subfamily serine protease
MAAGTIRKQDLTMRRLLPALLVVLSVPVAAADWVPVVKDIERKVPRLKVYWPNGDTGVCSAVFINADTGYLVTAAHCVEGDDIHLTVAGRDAAVVRYHRGIELAVVRVTPNKLDVTCPMAASTPPRGTEVAIAGYAFGFPQLSVQFGRLSLPYLRDDGVQLVNVDAISGDSGGALLDSDGALVGVVSAVLANGPMHLAVTIPIETIREYAGMYAPQEVK